MIKNRSVFIFLVLIMTSVSLYSQVQVRIQTLQYANNGQSTITAPNCGTIDLGNSSSTSINFGINLSKPLNMAVGDGVIKVFTKKSFSAIEVNHLSVNVGATSWTTVEPSTVSRTASISIKAEDFDVSGGTLFVVFTSASNVQYYSCNYSIIKAAVPTFTLSPTITSVACGDTSPRSFSVNATNIPAGASLSYVWSYSGWSGTATNTNTITLAPFPGTGLPSNVTVQPILNNVNQAILSCSVNRASFVSVSEISGPKGICSGSGNYSISNTAGQTVTWSLSNTAIGTLSNPSNTGVTVAFSGNGAQTLTATITNAC